MNFVRFVIFVLFYYKIFFDEIILTLLETSVGSSETEDLSKVNSTLAQDEGDRRFQCPYPRCDKLFKYKHHMTAHFTTKHTDTCESNVRKFVCDFEGCDKSYEFKYSLTRHMKKHE
jgi:uncharacterized C2H2 Zn-finger protein